MKVGFQRNFKNFFINFEEDEIDQSIASQFNGSLADQAPIEMICIKSNLFPVD
jgi:hypothetical protein